MTARPVPHPYAGLAPRPTARHALWALGLFLLSAAGALACGIGLGLLAEEIGEDAGPFISLGVVLGAAIPATTVLWVGFVRRCGWGLRELGFTTPTRSLWHLVWWTPLSILLAALGASFLGPFIGAEPEGAAIDEGFRLGPVAGVVIFAGAALLAPFFEEILFRRVMLDWLATRMPMWAAAVIVTVVFTVMHGSPSVMAYIIFFATSLALARLWFSSLWATFILHAVNNTLVTAIALAAL